MDTFSNLASSSFSTVVGYSPQMVATWATSSVLKLFVGLPLVIADKLTPWIIAGIVIGAILYFSLAAMHFLRH